MMPADPSDKRQQRNFGITMAAALCALGSLRWWHAGRAPIVLLVLAGGVLALGLAAPRTLRPALTFWLKLAFALNWAVTRVLLTALFFGMIVPGRVILALAGRDPLKRKWAPAADTYWEPAEEQPTEFERYRNHF